MKRKITLELTDRQYDAMQTALSRGEDELEADAEEGDKTWTAHNLRSLQFACRKLRLAWVAGAKK